MLTHRAAYVLLNDMIIVVICDDILVWIFNSISIQFKTVYCRENKYNKYIQYITYKQFIFKAMGPDWTSTGVCVP